MYVLEPSFDNFCNAHNLRDSRTVSGKKNESKFRDSANRMWNQVSHLAPGLDLHPKVK